MIVCIILGKDTGNSALFIGTFISLTETGSIKLQSWGLNNLML